jgi:D-alanyl-D-alanine carboxypeptidase (penicillin-binding protein 5/6)
MKRLSAAPFFTTLAAALVLPLAAPMAAQAQAPTFDTQASHAVIMDYETGMVLYSKNGDEPMHPSSMSKIMTVLMVLEALDRGDISLDTVMTTSEHAWRTGGFASGSSTMCLDPGEQVTVGELLQGVIVLSGNDASIVLAEGLSGTEEAFAADMEYRAHELGLSSASFRNATGWPDPEHKISARDLAEIARITIRDHPDMYAIYAEREYDHCVEAPSNRFNRNPVLGLVEGADGLKTGHTEEAGYSLVASAVRGDERRIIVFNGMPTNASRTQEAERMLRAAFTEFEVSHPYDAGETVAELPVYLGVSETVPVRIDEGVAIGHHRRAARDATARLVYEGPLRAPIHEGDLVGKLMVEIPGSPVVERPVVAAASVEKVGLVGQATAGLMNLIRGADEEEAAGDDG